MIYLRKEREQFEATKALFATTFQRILETMWTTFQEKGKSRDVGSPLHHRQSPHHLVSMARTKVWRVEALMSIEGWEHDPKALALVREECYDAANFLGFTAALCSMLLTEVTETVKPAYGRGSQGG